jgi:hypothetical protein
MRTVTCVAIAVAVLAATALAQTPTAVRPAKHSETIGEPSYGGRIEGDTMEECWTIPSLPFFDTGNTCGFTFDYDEMCPYGSSSPDVVYCYSPPHDMCVSISLCDSYYDTKVYIYQDVAGNVPWPDGCNDDNFDCVDPPVSYTSWIESVELFAGHTYYIVVDGYGGQCGDYVLAVDEIDCPGPCDVICVGVPEGEPTCYDGYDDQYNGGCSSLTWSYIPAGPSPIVVCGEGGVFDHGGLTYRDTDWYLIYPCGGVPISITVEAEFGVLFGFVGGVPECIEPGFISFALADECTPTTLTEYLPCASVAIFVATDTWDPAYVCGLEYSLTVEGYTEQCDPTPVENMSWARVKSLYR